MTDTVHHTLGEMSLLEHLRELRKRLIYIALAIFCATFVAYAYSEPIFSLLTSVFYTNFHGGTLIGTGPAEAFLLKVKVSIFAGVLIVSPIIFYQIWKFIEPGLYSKEKRYALPFIFSATALFLCGVWFCYSHVLPFFLGFFADQYKSIGVVPQVRISEHLSMLMQALIGFGFMFELPVLAFFLARLGVINYKMMLGTLRYAIVAIFIISAVFAPPDVVTQIFVAGPMLILYAISILVVKLTESRTPAAKNLTPAVTQESANLPRN